MQPSIHISFTERKPFLSGSILAIISLIILFSQQCANPVDPLPRQPSVKAMNDTIVTAPVDLFLFADNATPAIPVRMWFWSFDGVSTFLDSTKENRIFRRFSRADTGRHDCVVFVQSTAGAKSQPDTFHVTVRSCRPVMVVAGDQVAQPGDTATYSVVSINSCDIGPSVSWSFDGGNTFIVSGSISTRVWSSADTGRATIIARASDLIAGWDVVDTAYTTVVPCRPSLNITADTQMYVGQTTILQVQSSSKCGEIRHCIWTWSNGTVDTTRLPQLQKTWTINDTALTEVAVKALLDNGVESNAVSTPIRIILSTPQVLLPPDTAIAVNQPLRIRAQVHSSRRVRFFHWKIDDRAVVVSREDSITVVWLVHQSGPRMVRLTVETEDGIQSDPDTMSVFVHLFAPVLTVPSDTAVSIHDTLIVTVAAQDTNGTIRKYYWSVGGFGWTDSTDTPFRAFSYQGVNPVRVVVGARDSDGLLAIDSLRIYFRPSPVVAMLSPADGDTVVYSQSDTAQSARDVIFRFTASGQNGASPRVRFYLGMAGTNLVLRYEGFLRTCTVRDLDTGDYHWRLTAIDTHGDSAVITGVFVRMVRKTVCFVGHSIVAGACGDGVSGGFRKGVLEHLRNAGGSKTIIRPVGPLVTPYMMDKFDDSCFALNGTTGPQMYYQFTAHQNLCADIWIMMFGVNSHYSSAEVAAAVNFIHAFHDRNPRSAIRVINGLRYAGTAPWYWNTSNLLYYNRILADTLASLRNAGWDAAIIDAYTAFTNNGALDISLMDPTPGDYYIHPNQAGYDVLRSLIQELLQ